MGNTNADLAGIEPKDDMTMSGNKTSDSSVAAPLVVATDPWQLFGAAMIGAVSGLTVVGFAVGVIVSAATNFHRFWLPAPDTLQIAIESIAASAVAGLGGLLVALVAGVLLAIPVAVIAWLTGRCLFLDEIPAWYTTLASGWLGMTIWLGPLLLVEAVPRSAWAALAAAVAAGQLGAALNLRRVVGRGWVRLAPDVAFVGAPRFAMRHLLALSTLAAVGGAIARLTPDGGRLVGIFLVATAWQLAAVGGAKLFPTRPWASPR